MSDPNRAKVQALVVAWRFLLPSYSLRLSHHHTRRDLLATSYSLSSLPLASSLTSYFSLCIVQLPGVSVTLRAVLTMSQSSQSYSPRPTCYRPHCRRRAYGHPPHSCHAHRVVLIPSCSSRRAHRVVSYLPTFLCFCTKCGSSIFRCTLDRMNRTGLSHYTWNPLCVCECDKSICYDVPCLDRQRDRGAITRIVRTPFALTRLRPEGKYSDTAASRRKMP